MKLSKIGTEIAIVASVCVPLAIAFTLPIFYHPVPKDPPQRTFNATAWQTTEHQEERFAMLDDLKRQHKVIGMTAPQVYRLLGEPDWDLSKDNWIGYSMGNVGKDSATMLQIHFEGGHVDKIQVHRDT